MKKNLTLEIELAREALGFGLYSWIAFWHCPPLLFRKKWETIIEEPQTHISQVSAPPQGSWVILGWLSLYELICMHKVLESAAVWQGPGAQLTAPRLTLSQRSCQQFLFLLPPVPPRSHQPCCNHSSCSWIAESKVEPWHNFSERFFPFALYACPKAVYQAGML